MEMVLIKIGSNEWNYMWDWIKSHPLNSGLEDGYLAQHPQSGEAWQYMASFNKGEVYLHEFRHRNHPITQKIEKLVCYGSGKISDDDIEKKLKIR